jgi:hypothetical protein
MVTMRVARGKVIAGRIVVEGAPFEDGANVTVIATEGGETFELGADDEAALLAAIAEVNRGEIVDGFELLAKLGPHD